jgi:hypothetical protein
MIRPAVLMTMLFAAALIGGCASAIMENYVGQRLMTPVSQYGPPAYAYDIGEDERAFMWRMDQQIIIPGHSAGTFSATSVGGSIYGYGSTSVMPPQVVSGTCFYTLYARRVEAGRDDPAAWEVTGFEPPRLSCE